MMLGWVGWVLGDATGTPHAQLMSAAAQGDAARVATLLAAHPTTSPNDGSSAPVHAACEHGHLAVLQVILDSMPMEMLRPVAVPHDQGAAEQLGGNRVQLPIHLACRSGSLQVLECLLERKSPLEWAGAVAHPVHLAAQFGHCAVLARLLETMAGVDIVDHDRTPLHTALGAQKYCGAVVRMLLEHKANAQLR